MMKKISKLALLAAATAFLLAAFPACSDDDDDTKTVQDETGGDENTGGDNGEGEGDSNSNTDDTSKPYVLSMNFSPTKEIENKDEKLDNVVTVKATAKNKNGVAQKIKLKNGSIEMTGMQARPDYGLEITFSKAATVKTKVTKKSGGSATKAVLVKTEWGKDENGKDKPIVVAETDGINEYNANNTATSVTERTIEVTEPGTYVFGADSNGCIVYSLVIDWKD